MHFLISESRNSWVTAAGVTTQLEGPSREERTEEVKRARTDTKGGPPQPEIKRRLSFCETCTLFFGREIPMWVVGLGLYIFFFLFR